jgi:hypothetical protein
MLIEHSIVSDKETAGDSAAEYKHQKIINIESRHIHGLISFLVIEESNR